MHAHLPQSKWTPLLSSAGYTLGFVVVILGRQQLFTENTQTVILPLLRQKRLPILRNVLRLWAVVLLANLAGAIMFAAVLAKTDVVDSDVFQSLTMVAREAMYDSFAVTLLRGIVAGPRF